MKTIPGYCLFSILFILMLIAPSKGHGQEVLATAGTYAEAAQGSLNWTIGEPLIATGIAGETILSQGFHQPLLMVTSVEAVDPKIALKLYPNPSSDLLNIELLETGGNDFEAVLFHPDGKALKRQRLDFQAVQVMNLQSLPAGTYLLSVFQDQELQASFSVVKH